ncbi:hypothetical protein OUZ56_015920 [Daphnia magna]|uniref:Secreted protein n=1 Tax=Daphnia magna TaxID=35525 RepID=A0ABR0AP46_9CRUS|nr:hypothetical protein OUZ56_015920 [Daphnia magna]
MPFVFLIHLELLRGLFPTTSAINNETKTREMKAKPFSFKQHLCHYFLVLYTGTHLPPTKLSHTAQVYDETGTNKRQKLFHCASVSAEPSLPREPRSVSGSRHALDFL